MVLKLYTYEASPYVRSVLLTAAALDLKLEKIEVDLFNGEQMTPEFLKMNPAHCIPVLDDDGIIVNDSHAILPYLVDKYGKNDSLYPKDLAKRALVHTLLNFDSSRLYSLLLACVIPIYGGTLKSPSSETIEKINTVYELLEKYLERSTFVAGDNLTIADFSVVANISSLNFPFLCPINSTKFPKITSWFNKIKKLPYYEENGRGLREYFDLLESYRAKIA